MSAPLVLPAAGDAPSRPVRAAVTGDVPGLTRDAAWAAITALGGEVVKGVGPKTDLLIVGPGSGKKVDEARVRRIRVLEAAAFAALVANPQDWDGTTVGELLAAPPPVVREPVDPNAVLHALSVSSGWTGGEWGGRVSCKCGWTGRAAGWQAADALGRAHAGRAPDPG